MKVHPAAWQGLEDHLEAKAEEQANAFENWLQAEHECAMAFIYDDERKREQKRDDINRQARTEGWSASRWLEAIRLTNMFDEEELKVIHREQLCFEDWMVDPSDYSPSFEIFFLR